MESTIIEKSKGNIDTKGLDELYLLYIHKWHNNEVNFQICIIKY